MSNRNFDSRVITDRQQACNHARYVYTTQRTGTAPLSNPQTSNPDASTVALFQAGSPSFYQKGLLGGHTQSQPGGTC